MKAFAAIVKATALEMLSEPLTLLILLAALVLTVFAPVFHYHQFGEASRMARDSGFSAIFTCGSALAVFGTVRAFRREAESGTREMALAHPISGELFFFGKAVGCLLALLTAAAVVFLSMVVIVIGSEIGGMLAERTGDVARVWGPAVAAGVAIILAPLAVGALLNRCCRFRFVLTAVLTALALAVLAAGALAVLATPVFAGEAPRLLAAAVPLVAFEGVLLLCAAAFAVRFRANVAASATGLVVLAFLPALGNYYLADALAHGGAVPLSFVALAVAALLPAALCFLVLGCLFGRSRS